MKLNTQTCRIEPPFSSFLSFLFSRGSQRAVLYFFLPLLSRSKLRMSLRLSCASSGRSDGRQVKKTTVRQFEKVDEEQVGRTNAVERVARRGGVDRCG
jgi:hypothetical protein